MPRVPASHVLLAEPRGFCAGVESAVKSLAWMVVLHPPPVFCVHAVVHNEHVVERFERLGVRFVTHPEQASIGAAVLLSAHGSSPAAVEAARARASVVVDAVCPLVTKVHHEIRSRAAAGGTVVYIGHEGHDEAVGAVAQAPGRVVRVESAADVARAVVPEGRPVAVLAQTTLAQHAWDGVVAAARSRFGDVWLPPRADLCFATTNRQRAVRHLARRCDAVVVVGSPTSSNTRALAQTARDEGCGRVLQVAGAGDLPLAELGRVGVTAGASTPASVVDQVVAALAPASVEPVPVVSEDEYFPLAPPLRRRLGRLDAAGALPPSLRAAFRHDRTTTADELLDRIETGELVGALDGIEDAELVGALDPGGRAPASVPGGGRPGP
jgi:4-hydroxy-3-methylbut-2-enyl diphosphate reductase